MTKPSSFCAPLLLFLVWRAAEVAEACSCSPNHPQQAYCNADVGKIIVVVIIFIIVILSVAAKNIIPFTRKYRFPDVCNV